MGDISGFKSPNIVTTSGSMPDNPSGLLGHPKKAQIVVNDQTGFNAQGGNDGFSEKSPKASVKLTTPPTVS